MKRLELIPQLELKTAEQLQKIAQQSLVLTVGMQPRAVLLPQFEVIANFGTGYAEVVGAEESVMLTVAGRPIAILQLLVPLLPLNDEQADLESVLLSTNIQFLKILERSDQSLKSQGGISSESMRERLGSHNVKEVKVESRATALGFNSDKEIIDE